MLRTTADSFGVATMTDLTSSLPRRTHLIAVTVVGSDRAMMLCPFFGKCDGVVIIDAEDGARTFYPNEPRTSATLCDVILGSGADQLICGFIGRAEKHRLRAAGIDVRLGSCTCSVDELAAGFADLPKA